MRAKSGHQVPILELFQQIHKTYITWPGSKDYAKHQFHMAKLDAAVNKLPPHASTIPDKSNRKTTSLDTFFFFY